MNYMDNSGNMLWQLLMHVSIFDIQSYVVVYIIKNSITDSIFGYDLKFDNDIIWQMSYFSLKHQITISVIFLDKFWIFWETSFSWILLWTLSNNTNIQSIHIHFVPCQSGILFLSYDVFIIKPWKSRAKVMGDVTVQSLNVDLTSYRLASLSFHVNRSSHSWDTAFPKFYLENPGSMSNDHDVVQLSV